MKKSLLLIPLIAMAALGGYLLAHRGMDTGSPPRVIAMVQLTEVDANTKTGFKEGLIEFGYREGKDLHYLDDGPVGAVERLDSVIRAHLQNRPDLFMVSSTPGTLAVKRLTEGRAIPVVFAPVNDPLAAGIVTDLKHPGGFITGIRLPTGDDLRLEWLTKIVPECRRIFVPYHADDKSAQATVQQIERVAPKLGLDLMLRDVNQAGGIAALIADMPVDIDAIFLPRDSRIGVKIDVFVAAARARRLPIAAPGLLQVRRGALLSYGFVHHDIGRQAARLADQIFQGIAPGNLPVEMAENSLSLNLVTARELGIEIPDHILLQAEHVIRE